MIFMKSDLRLACTRFRHRYGARVILKQNVYANEASTSFLFHRFNPTCKLEFSSNVHVPEP